MRFADTHTEEKKEKKDTYYSKLKRRRAVLEDMVHDEWELYTEGLRQSPKLAKLLTDKTQSEFSSSWR